MDSYNSFSYDLDHQSNQVVYSNPNTYLNNPYSTPLKYSIDSKFNCYLVYIVQGNIVAHIGNNLRRLSEGFLLALPVESRVTFEALSSDTEIFLICLDEIPKTIGFDDVVYNNVEDTRLHLPYRNVIDTSDLLRSFFLHTVNLLRKGINSSELKQMLVNEYRMNLRSLCTRSEMDMIKQMYSSDNNDKNANNDSTNNGTTSEETTQSSEAKQIEINK